MVINGVTISDPDVGDLEFRERYEAQNNVILAKMKEIDNNISGAAAIRTQCTLVFEFFDTVFGEGTAKKIFGEKVNLKTCIDAYEEAVKGVISLDAQLANYFRNKTANRQQKRQNQHRKR